MQRASANGFGVALSAPIIANNGDIAFPPSQGRASFESQPSQLHGRPSSRVSADHSLLALPHGTFSATHNSRGVLKAASSSPMPSGGVVKVKGAHGRSTSKKHLGSNDNSLDAHAGTSSNQGGSSPCSTSDIPEEILKSANYDIKRARRIQANRESAIKSKERKAQYSMTLDHQLQGLNEEVENLTTRIAALRSHNDSLGQYVREVSGQCAQMSQLLNDGWDKNRRLSELVLNLQSTLGLTRRLPQEVQQEPAADLSPNSHQVPSSSSALMIMDPASQKLLKGSRDELSCTAAAQLSEPKGLSFHATAQNRSSSMQNSREPSPGRRNVFAEAIAAAVPTLEASLQAAQQHNQHLHRAEQALNHSMHSSPLAVPSAAVTGSQGPASSQYHRTSDSVGAVSNGTTSTAAPADGVRMSMSISPTAGNRMKPGLLSMMVQQQQQKQSSQ